MSEEQLQAESTALEQDVVLEVRNVTKTFPGVRANDDVNIKLRRGEILALLGENGAGKSTLMNIIYGLYQQDEGEIYLNGREARFANPREAIHSGIGMVHQHFQLVDVMTVAENVILGEEKEAPTWSSLFNAFFSFIFAAVMTALLVMYNDPLIYASITLATVGLILPWYAQRYIFTPIGFAIIGTAALALGIGAAGIEYPDQYLFIDIVVLLGMLLLIYTLLSFVPRTLFDWMHQQRRWLVVLLQALALGGLLLMGLDANTSSQELIFSFVGMGILGIGGFYLPRLLSADNPAQRILGNTQPSGGIDNKVWYTGLGIAILGAVGLSIVAFMTVLSLTIWDDSNAYIRWREFMGLASIGLIGATLAVGILSYLAMLVVKSWDQVVGGLRLLWGFTWRIGLIAVAVWAGGQARNISEMAIITAILQTPVDNVDFQGTPRNVDSVVVEGQASGEIIIEPRWRRIDSEPSRSDQINALLAEIDEAYTDEETGELTYTGRMEDLRNAVVDVPPLVDDITIGLLLVLFGVLSVQTWRGTQLLPGRLYPISLGIIALLVLIYAGSALALTAEISMAAQILLFLLIFGATGVAFYFTYRDRQTDPERIRPITPLDTFIDALADLVYTILSVRRTREAAERVRELSKQHGLEVDPDAIIEKLPVGLQQRVEIIKALYRKADILILDEPTAVLTPQEGEELFKIMKDLSSQGVSIIFISHKLKEVFKVATNVVVMRGGRVVGTTTPAEATEASLAAMMVGREVLLRVDKDDAKPTNSILQVENLQATDERGAKALDGVSFEVRAGEVLGIAGVQGNGQSELVEVLTGLRPMDEGAVELLGQELKPQRYADAGIWARGMAVIVDWIVVGLLASVFSFFWSYLSVGVDDFSLISQQTLIIFLIIDAMYTLGFWLLPVLLSDSSSSGATTIDLDTQQQTMHRNIAGQTLGKLMLGLEVTQQDDRLPSVPSLIIRYLGQSASRYLLPVYLVASLLLAFNRSEPTIYERWRATLRTAWYDNLLNLRVAYHASITPRKIKDSATSHVPEDRLRFGMVKPFTVAENLILNDYYEKPHAQPPSGIQLPFVTAAYAVLFGAIFAMLGYLWLYFWNDSLWTGLLNSYGVPDTSFFRTIPTDDTALRPAQRNNLDNPLLVSLVALLAMTGGFTIVAYVLTQLITRFIVKPFSIVPPLTFMGVAYLGWLLFDTGLHAIGLESLWLGVMSIIHGLFGASSDVDGAINRMIVYGIGLAVVVAAGLVYDRIRPEVVEVTQANLQRSPVGQTLLEYNTQGLVLNLNKEDMYSRSLIEEYDIRTPSSTTSGGSLSGGNQQKVVVAREFVRKPRLLIASQPTRGIDVGSIEFIHKQIISQRDQGAAVLLVSAELDEIMSLSDRIAVMYRGKIIRVVDAKEATREGLGLLMAGIEPD